MVPGAVTAFASKRADTIIRPAAKDPGVDRNEAREGSRSRGIRRHHRDPQGQSQQIRGRPPQWSHPARPDPVHGDPVPRRLRLHRQHPGPGRRSAGRPRPAVRADVPRLPDPGPRHRHVPHDRREGPGRQGPVRLGQRSPAGQPPGHRRHVDLRAPGDPAASSRSTRTWSPGRASRAPTGSDAATPRPRSASRSTASASAWPPRPKRSPTAKLRLTTDPAHHRSITEADRPSPGRSASAFRPGPGR